ncbi:MAG: hypothetical protein FJ290_10300 [Planctomycetes bacterium]|nr:hypothetical protein [Planctomycetota bacterium]
MKRSPAAMLLLASMPAFAAMKDVPHPFLLWTRDEAAALRQRIESDPAAKRQYERMAKMEGTGKASNPTMLNLFKYLVLGDGKAGEREKAELVKFIGTKPEPMTWPPEKQKEFVWNVGMPSAGDRHMRDERTLYTLRYDALYDQLTPDERKGIEDAFRAYIKFHLGGHKPWHPDFRYDRTSWLPNMHWPRAIGTHLMAVALKDEKLIDAMFNATGGWKWFFDDYITDGRFYNEEFGKYYSNIGTMLMWCESLEKLGLGQYGYGYKGKGGATMRSFLEMKMWAGLPRIERPGGMPEYPIVTMGDAGTSPIVAGYGADGKGGDAWWSNAHMNGPLPKMRDPLWWEMGHRRWPDAHFDYFLAQMRAPGEEVYLPSLYFGLGPIDPKKITPPPAQSYVARERGFALLRAEESPAYWESSKPAVALQFAMRYVHYVHDCFTLLDYVAFNAPIYRRMGGVKRGYAGSDPWRDHVRGMCGVVVDGLQAQPVDDGSSGTKNHRIREHFSPPAKLVAVRAKGVYPDVDMERALVLATEYLLDLFWLKSGKPRVYDWQVLSPGTVEGIGAGPWKPAPQDFTKPHLSAIQILEPGDKPWAATILLPGERGIGVRVNMLGATTTQVLASRPPGLAEKEPGTSLLATRACPSTLFAALHEPFAGGMGKHRIERFGNIAQNDEGIGVIVSGKEGINDRILLRYGDGADKPLTLEGEGESYTFSDCAFIRIGSDKVEAHGGITALKLRVAGSPKLILNGKQAPAQAAEGVLSFETK